MTFLEWLEATADALVRDMAQDPNGFMLNVVLITLPLLFFSMLTSYIYMKLLQKKNKLEAKTARRQAKAAEAREGDGQGKSRHKKPASPFARQRARRDD